MKKTITTILKFLLFAGVGVTILYFVYQQQQASLLAKCIEDGVAADQCSLLDKLFDDFKSLNFWWILAVILAFTLSNISRAIRWGMLIEPLSHRPRLINTFLTVVIGYLSNMALPRIGEIIRGATLARYEKIPVEKVMGTIVVDRVMDILYLLFAIALAFFLEFDTLLAFFNKNLPEDFSMIGFLQHPAILGLAALSLIGVILLYVFRASLKESRFYQKFINILRGFWEGIQTIRRLDRPWLFIFHSTNLWVMYFLMTYLCFFAFEPVAHLSPEAGLMVFVFGAFGIVIPSPGGMGTYHWLAIQALALYAIDSNDAFSFANIIYFTIQIFYNVIVGTIAFLTISWINRNYHPKVAQKPLANESLDAH